MYERLSVEQPVTRIILKLQGNEQACVSLNVRHGILFENYANILGDENEEVRRGLQELHLSGDLHSSSRAATPRNSDQISVYKDVDGI